MRLFDDLMNGSEEGRWRLCYSTFHPRLLLLFNVTQHFSVRLVVTLNKSHAVHEEN